MPKKEIKDQIQAGEDEIDLSSIFERENLPDFEKDPIPKIEEWVEKFLPEGIQEKVLGQLVKLRGGKQK